ncbi:hypothetical protein HBB16_04705 [Pseudonocardia sp. MCCB 268]|nr:hypothetical protein [Pseudonocardia cytotoxica]
MARTGPVLVRALATPLGTVVLRAIGSVDDETAPDLCTELGLCAEEGSDVVLTCPVSTSRHRRADVARRGPDLLAAEGTQLRILCGGSSRPGGPRR